MATLTTRNGIYYADFFDANRRPQRKRLSLKTRNRTAALKLLSRAEEAYRLLQWDPWNQPLDVLQGPAAGPVRLDEALARYLCAKAHDLGSLTLRSYRSVLTRFIEQTGQATLLVHLSAAQIDAFVRADSIARTTRCKRYSLVKAFLRWCEKHGYLQHQPMHEVAAPRKPERIPRAVTPDDLERICAALRADYRQKVAQDNGQIREGELLWFIPMWWFALYTGLRVSELARLKWAHIDRDRRLIYIYEQKSGKQSTLPLNIKAAEVLSEVPVGAPDEYVFHSPLYPATSRNIECFCRYATEKFRTYRKAAGIERRLTTHGLRHGHCTLLAEHGKPAYVIMASARHANIQTSMVYVSLHNDHLRAELDDVFGDASSGAS